MDYIKKISHKKLIETNDKIQEAGDLKFPRSSILTASYMVVAQ